MDQQPTTTAVPRFAPALIALLWVGALEWYRVNPKIGAIAMVVVFAATSIWAYRHRQHLVSRGSFWLGITVYAVTGLGALSFVSTPFSQHLVIAIMSIVAWFYLRQAVRPTSSELQGRTATFVMSLVYFSGVMSLLSLGIFARQPWWVVVGGGTVLYTLVAAIVWLDLEVPLRNFRRSLPWMAFLGAELMGVAWWLPTSVYASSILVTTIGVLFIHLGRHVWGDTWRPARGRRYLAIGLAIVVLVLLTARWN